MPKSETFDRTEVMQNITGVFWKKGYSGTSMQDIVDASGLNRSSIYNSFGDKYQLFLAALKHYKGRQQSEALQCLLNNTPKQALRSFFSSAALSFDGNEDSNGCFFTNSTAELSNRDNEVASYLTANLKDMTNLFADILRKGIEMDEFKMDMDVEATSLYLFNSLQGLKLTGMLVSSPVIMQKLVDQILDKL